MAYRSTLDARDGFDRLLLAEWTKLRSVPRWMLTLLGAVALTASIALVAAAGADDTASDERFRDAGQLVSRPLVGDGELVARVASQRRSGPWAKAGLMLRDGLRHGAPYAALFVTPAHGVRLQSNPRGGVAGGVGGAPRWLRLRRAGDAIVGYESADGARWRRVGAVRLAGLPRTVAVGLFVASPDRIEVERRFGGESIAERSTVGAARFDGVRSPPSSAPWRVRGPDAVARSGDAFALTGSGDVGRYRYGTDSTRTALSGVLVALIAIVALAALFVSSEYASGTIRTTFAACPRRGRVLAAKAVVIGTAAFAAGLVGSVAAFLLARPLLSSEASLTDGPVLRALAGSGLLLAAIALLSLGVAALLRRGGPAIALVLLLLLVPQLVASGLPLSTAVWVERVTPAAGFAIQRTLDRYDAAIDPWAGLGVLCGYAALALALAGRRLRRIDA